jgi:hypothetical protein
LLKIDLIIEPVLPASYLDWVMAFLQNPSLYQPID